MRDDGERIGQTREDGGICRTYGSERENGRESETSLDQAQTPPRKTRKPHKSSNVRSVIFVVIVALLRFASVGNYTLYRIAPNLFSVGGKLASPSANDVGLEEIKENPVASLLNDSIAKHINSPSPSRLDNSFSAFDTMLTTNATLRRMRLSSLT